jgi:hypothetical protein
MRTDDLSKNSALFLKPGRVVTGEREQENLKRKPQRPNKQLRAQSANDTEHHRIY